MDEKLLNLIIIQTRDIGPGFQLANRAATLDCEILELSIMGKGALVILSTGENDPELIRSKIGDRDALISTHKNLPGSIFDAYLSVNEPGKLSSDLVIFEGPFLGHLFEICQKLPEAKILDIRLMRGSSPKAYLMLSAVDAEVLGGLHSHQVMITHITELSSTLKSYFEIVPNQ
jgi:hypothetical protein